MINRVLLLLMTCGLLLLNSKEPLEAQVLPKQDWLQKTYNNVVIIDDDKVAKSRGSYLIDVPIQENADSCYVFFVNAKVPAELFIKQESFYPDIKEFILIMPDWKLHQKVAENAKKSGVTLEPTVTNRYYRIRRNGNSVQADSLRISDNRKQPHLKYAALKTNKDMLKFYLAESYGSVCCPRDPQWELFEEDVPFMKAFEKKHKVNITETFRQTYGKEGEHTVYYTLPKLTTKQRLIFILDKRWQWILKKKENILHLNRRYSHRSLYHL
uniref:hypothetical protein n=1 Tax=Mucilaginibacter sp. Bleaf8 TaxID=2834430 RepID=UPI0020C0E49E|nr:hypothetical protein [Mucilaginibacter sp. Bleaf8]